MDIFVNARQNFLRRQRAVDEADVERQEQQQQPPPPPQQRADGQEMAERSPGGSILRRFTDIRRPAMPSFISRRSSRQPRPSSSNYDDEAIESPKTPRFNLRMPAMPSTRLDLPNLDRTWTQGSNGPQSPSSPRSTSYGSPYTDSRTGTTQSTDGVSEPAPVHHARQHSRTESGGSRRFRGADPEEAHLASMAADGRRRGRRHGRRAGDAGAGREARRHGRRKHRHARERRPPKRFLFCFPWIASRRIRSQILRCFVSGMFLVLLLSVCK
jgi:hypothetical protein